jgi:hypothetical protein
VIPMMERTTRRLAALERRQELIVGHRYILRPAMPTGDRPTSYLSVAAPQGVRRVCRAG